MIDLYTAPTPNGWKVSILLEEPGPPYTVRPIMLHEGQQRAPWYLKINPNGRIPTIIDKEAGDFAVPGEIDPAIQKQCIEKFRKGEA